MEARRLGLLTLAGILAAGPGFGAGRLTLDQAVKEALSSHPGLRRLHAEASALNEREAQESALPNPTVKYGTMNPSDHIELIDGEETRIALEQELPAFGKRELRGALAGRQAALAWVELRIRENEVVYQVREAAYDLAAIQAGLALLRQEQAVFDRFEQSAKQRLEVGTAEAADVLRAQSEAVALRQRRLEMERREQGLLARLRRLLNRSPADPVEAVEAPPPALVPPLDPDALMRGVADTKPELVAADLRVEQATYAVQLAAKNGWPDFMISAEKRSYADGDDQVMLMAGLTLPLWRASLRAANREAAHNLQAGEAGLQAAELEARFEIEDACFGIESARRTLALSKDSLVPQAEQRFASAESAYTAGRLPFADLLASEQFLLEARLMAVMNEAEFGKQAARLDQALGRPFKPAKPAAAPVP